MRKVLCICFTFFCIAAASYAQVNEEEISNVPPVSFLNYDGPHTRIDTRSQIRDIGYSLGILINRGARTAGARNRYFVIHSVTEPEGDKLDADIFGLGADVGVDHIRNLRLIIQGYLEGAYNYSAADAALLATYITTYNAVYRSNWNYFVSRYKTVLIGALSQEQVGLSIRFDEWPGKTLLVIPLRPIGPVDTTTISDENVVNELRRTEDMGIEQRKEMVDLKEREVEQAEEQAEEKQEEIETEQAQIQEEYEEVSAEREKIEQEREEIIVENRPPDLEKAEEIVAKQEELQQREKELDEKEEVLADRKAAVEEKKEEVEQLRQFAEEKTQDAQKDRQEIAEDQQTLAVPPASKAVGIPGVLLSTASNPLGYIVTINPENGKEINRSIVNTFNARTFTMYNKRLFAVAGGGQGSAEIRIVEIDLATLEIINKNDENIAPESLLWFNENSFYAIVTSGGMYYLSRFDTDLKKQAQSSVAVNPFSTVNIQGKVLLIQSSDDDQITILDRYDLTEQ
ncbi:MAG: hypothetical protein LBO67_05340 [Spirochaetaceae bacterium]|jgi:hypothetical protein|nr:hypothetical protein [Spirochaetaceae bacterium]